MGMGFFGILAFCGEIETHPDPKPPLEGEGT
jgi:hypothetical protein